MGIIRSILPHVIIILSGIFLVLLILDNYNPTMNFIDNTISMKLFWAYGILSIINSILFIAENRKDWRRKNKSEME
jgi:hypothetical protein